MLSSILIGVAGAAVVLVTLVDAIWTTLWLEGKAGPISRHSSGAVRAALRRLLAGSSQPATREEHRRLSVIGPAVLTASVLLRVFLLLVGWVMLFSASPSSLLDSRTHAQAAFADRVYFVGYSMLTVGNGDFAPNGKLWEAATVLAGLTGLVLVTLAITFIVAVIEAVVARRAFATQVFTLGRCGESFVVNAWDGRGFPALDVQLLGLGERLGIVTEQHEAYPLLHFYHAAEEHRSVSAALAVFDTALLLLERGVQRGSRPAPVALRSARGAVRGYLETLRGAHVEPSPDLPPPPDLARLRGADIPVVSDAELAGGLRDEDERRRLLFALVQNDRRAWPPADRD